MKNDGAKVFSIITDHGHWAGQDHFVVIVTWSGRDSNGNRTIKFFCLSIDLAGHHAVEAAKAVKNAIQQLFIDEDIKVVAATSDSGGGSSI